MCNLVRRFDGHGGDVRRLWGCVTVVSNCGSPKGGVTSIRKLCQLIERCDGHGGDVKILG